MRGSFRYDADVAAQGGESAAATEATPPDESLVIDPASQGIRNVVVFARRVSRVHTSHALRAGELVVLAQREGRFVPHVVSLTLEQPLHLRNDDREVHTFTLRPAGERELNVLVSPGDVVHHGFTRPQQAPVAVTCQLCPWERAYVLPRADAYVAVTDERGEFEIPDLPADEEMEFQVWHERGAGPRGALVAHPDWAGGRFRASVPRGGFEYLGQVLVSKGAFRPRHPAAGR